MNFLLVAALPSTFLPMAFDFQDFPISSVSFPELFLDENFELFDLEDNIDSMLELKSP